GCHGFCEMGPLVRIEPYGYLYLKVTLEDCEEIIEKTLIKGEPVERLMYRWEGRTYAAQEEIPFYKKQTRLVLEHCGHIDAESIREYIAKGGYKALSKCLFEMTPEQICKVVSDSNLRGRGGGGYPAGKKWSQVLAQNSAIKYVVCNGDEGDPGAFMDRSIMEGDPHRMIEGMIIAGVATGSSEGYIYVRAEYPLAVERLKVAIDQAREYGLLGENILDSGFNFDIHINQGAGAFVCGEGSALTASIEGERGMPRVKPPRTVEAGLWGKPTVLNNVETFANVPQIIINGSEWYKSIGPEKSPGTKAFAITGNVNNTGLIEVPMGTTLREVIFEIGGGIKNNKKFKAVQIGGPSGGCLTEEHLDLPLDFDSLKKVGAMIGSGGLVVMDEDTCMVEVARFFMNFTQNESCGKCVPCREGTKRMLEILERIVGGKGTVEDLDLLLDLADTISKTALCGLGKTAAGPVVSTLKYFRDEYIAHVVDKKCPSKTCQALRSIEINKALCKGCGKCTRVCPVNAIEGKIKEPYSIDQKKCIKCGACLQSCPFSAIEEV
ncbi:MAG: NADH:ubiquinone oxidoreductase, NADH-binding (51 kD) subunit, partial [Clostridia bacterium]|nr:NADH:ubiquinone oxidoreductase, NADH-binding (51 kD) subunit [Clostridia bacterium]